MPLKKAKKMMNDPSSLRYSGMDELKKELDI